MNVSAALGHPRSPKADPQPPKRSVLKTPGISTLCPTHGPHLLIIHEKNFTSTYLSTGEVNVTQTGSPCAKNTLFVS